MQTVVTDIEMPSSMDSLEPARMVQEPWPGIGVVVTSGRVRPGPMTCRRRLLFSPNLIFLTLSVSHPPDGQASLKTELLQSQSPKTKHHMINTKNKTTHVEIFVLLIASGEKIISYLLREIIS